MDCRSYYIWHSFRVECDIVFNNKHTSNRSVSSDNAGGHVQLISHPCKVLNMKLSIYPNKHLSSTNVIMIGIFNPTKIHIFPAIMFGTLYISTNIPHLSSYHVWHFIYPYQHPMSLQLPCLVVYISLPTSHISPVTMFGGLYIPFTYSFSHNYHISLPT